MFKRSLFLIFVFIGVSFADMMISPFALPENIKQFINSNFKAQIGVAQQDDDSFEIYLSDGTELEFDITGNWKEIENDFAPISFSVLPVNIATIIQNTYQGAFMLKVKRKFNYYDIKLSNSIELKIDPNGSILEQKFDD